MSYYSQEIAVFEAKLPSWLESGQEGKWVVIKQDEIVGVFSEKAGAYDAAVARFGTGAEFLLRQIKRFRPTLLAPIMSYRTETC